MFDQPLIIPPSCLAASYQSNRPRRRFNYNTRQLSRYSAVQAIVLILGDEARYAKLVRHIASLIQGGEGRQGAGLRVVAGLEQLEALAVGRVVGQSDARGQVGRAVEGAAALAVVALHEGVLEDPVGACARALEARDGAVAGGTDAVSGEQVYLGHDTRHVDALIVAYAAAIVGRRL